jgi:hypothetical protein
MLRFEASLRTNQELVQLRLPWAQIALAMKQGVGAKYVPPFQKRANAEPSGHVRADVC